MVYAPWCGHCKKFEPIYEDFAKLVSESPTAASAITVAKMDGTANKVDNENFKVTGYPTIWFVRKGSDTPIKYSGNRTAKDLLAFIQKHTTSSTKIALNIHESTPEKTLSQPVPLTNDGPVKVVVSESFKSMVLESEKVRPEGYRGN